MKVHKISFRNKKPGEISTGFNTDVLLDDEVLHGVQSVIIEITANEVATVTIKMVAELDTPDDSVNIPVIYNP